ncbi:MULTISPECIES: hypothetical protein [Calothrix]|uniref:Lipoprotein n=2 Tax=Calothrix TaxID=1186 RepID=A0ABR8AHK5_9CYAN|nr:MULTISPECIES: hypothetical protein [Calothrix]MBD2199423.1 hypothetical protein [Calothrix parietina FACHB-288]MBD2228224.1 hypothetical protein [Calothrix anomala FACHB-343]
MIRVKWLRLAIATTMPLLVMGCDTLKQVEFNCDNSSVSSTPNLSQNLNIQMYVDGTPSMQGYVTHPQNTRTRYIETIDLLDQTLLTGWTPQSRNQSQVQYFRLGENYQKINRDDYLLARQAKFYDGKVPQKFPLLKVSNIDNAITPAQDNKLTVIVTDLYQKGADVTKLKQKLLSENYFNPSQPGYAVGILAIKSEFNGDVYLEDGTDKKFTYTTNNSQGNVINGKELRPFYVIFLGRYSDIADYLNKLSESQKIPENSQVTIFSPSNLVTEVAYLQRLSKDSQNKGSDKPHKDLKFRQSLKEEIKVNKNPKNELFAIDQKANQDITVNYQVPLKTDNHTLQVDPTSIETKMKVDTSALSPGAATASKTLQEVASDSQLQTALALNQWQINGNNLSFQTTIKPSLFPQREIYLFTVEALAKRVQTQPWWVEWNTYSNSSNDWKTYNLQPFMEGLKDNTENFMSKSPVVVGRFCFAMQKN